MEQERRGSGCRLTMPPPASLAARPRRVREAQAFPLLTPTTEVTAGFSPVSGGRNPPFPHSAGRRSLGLHRCAFSSGPKPGVWFCLRSPANLCSYAPKRRKVILQARDDPPPTHTHPIGVLSVQMPRKRDNSLGRPHAGLPSVLDCGRGAC